MSFNIIRCPHYVHYKNYVDIVPKSKPKQSNYPKNIRLSSYSSHETRLKIVSFCSFGFFHSNQTTPYQSTMVNLDSLPDDCFSEILSLTSPRDACNASLVSSSIRLSANSDAIWERFLPSDYSEIVSRMDLKLKFSSKKELFFELCHPHLLDGGKKMFWIERSSGKKNFALGARELSIVWADNPLYWTWKPFHTRTRFSEVLELRTICWLQIQARFPTKFLSPNTTYAAYLVVRLADRAYGLDTLPSHVSVKVGFFESKGEVFLLGSGGMRRRVVSLKFGDEVPVEREDGWLEVELGRFYNEGGCGSGEEMEMCLKEVDGVHLKGGLIVEGIEIRPKF
ncbi:F-box protein PP2-B10 [Linum perenne]